MSRYWVERWGDYHRFCNTKLDILNKIYDDYLIIEYLKNDDIKYMIRHNYFDCINFLISKYGNVPYDYFCNENLKSKNKKNSRTKEGLVIHHIYEYRHVNLSSQTFAKFCSFEVQKSYNLCYCNMLEHIILHIKISNEIEIYRSGCVNLELSNLTIDNVYDILNISHYMPGVFFISSQFLNWIVRDDLKEWEQNCKSLILNNENLFDDFMVIFVELYVNILFIEMRNPNNLFENDLSRNDFVNNQLYFDKFKKSIELVQKKFCINQKMLNMIIGLITSGELIWT